MSHLKKSPSSVVRSLMDCLLYVDLGQASEVANLRKALLRAAEDLKQGPPDRRTLMRRPDTVRYPRALYSRTTLDTLEAVVEAGSGGVRRVHLKNALQEAHAGVAWRSQSEALRLLVKTKMVLRHGPPVRLWSTALGREHLETLRALAIR